VTWTAKADGTHRHHTAESSGHGSEGHPATPPCRWPGSHSGRADRAFLAARAQLDGRIASRRGPRLPRVTRCLRHVAEGRRACGRGLLVLCPGMRRCPRLRTRATTATGRQGFCRTCNPPNNDRRLRFSSQRTIVCGPAGPRRRRSTPTHGSGKRALRKRPVCGAFLAAKSGKVQRSSALGDNRGATIVCIVCGPAGPRRRRSTPTHGSGKRAKRFIAASSFRVIRDVGISNDGACRDSCRWNRPYSRRHRTSTSGGSFPGVRSRRRGPVGPQAMVLVRLKPDTTTELGPAEGGHYAAAAAAAVRLKADTMIASEL
jgi:hypothetical protein